MKPDNIKPINLGNSGLLVSPIALGCMRLSALDEKDFSELIKKAIDLGINLFDHADIYGRGVSEEKFGNFLKKNKGIRNKIIIQTKCGIGKGYYNLSAEHIINSLEKSLVRLKTDYVDILLLHRPDALFQPEAIRAAFNKLYRDGKVRYFGVSNMNVPQIELLKKHLEQRLIVNQLQFSIVHAPIIDEIFNFNMANDLAVNRSGGMLDYARLNNITIQAWSVLQASWKEGTFIENPKYQKLNDELTLLSRKYMVSKAAIAVNWILRHPAKIEPIVGTTSPIHLAEIIAAVNIELERQEWYNLYLSVGKTLP